eukprot:3417832-Amphidinium_carterae.1
MSSLQRTTLCGHFVRRLRKLDPTPAAVPPDSETNELSHAHAQSSQSNKRTRCAATCTLAIAIAMTQAISRDDSWSRPLVSEDAQYERDCWKGLSHLKAMSTT